MLMSSALIAMAVAALVALTVRWLLRPKHPPTATFRCARCSVVSRHTARTSEAWRRNAKSLFCDSCHRKWLESQPQQGNAAPHRAPASSNRGWLGVVLLIALIPIALLTIG